MNIHFKCPACGKHLEIDEAGAGMTVPCTDCSTSVTIPAPTAKHTCPQCYVSVLVDDSLKGATFECSTCHQMYHIPSPDDVTEHKCPFCHIVVPVPAKMRGQFISCPNCIQQFLVPGAKLEIKFQHPPPPDSKPERLDLLTKGSQWFKRDVGDQRANNCSETTTHTGLDKLNRVGGKIGGIPMLIGFTMQFIGYIFQIPWLGDIGGILFVSGVIIGLLLGVIYVLGIFITKPFKAIATTAVIFTAIVAIGDTLLGALASGWSPRLDISSFSGNRQNTDQATASSGQGSFRNWVISVFTSARQRIEPVASKDVSIPYIEANKGRVYYKEPATKSEATALCNYFVPEIFDGSEKLVELSCADGFYCLLLPISPSLQGVTGLTDEMSVLAFTISTDVFADKPVKINLCDQQFAIFASVTSMDGAEHILRVTGPNSGRSSDRNSVAYDRGYEHGRRMGEMDRNFGTYSHASTDTRVNDSFYSVPSLAGYGMGTTEYGEFVSGYEQGYLEGRQ